MKKKDFCQEQRIEINKDLHNASNFILDKLIIFDVLALSMLCDYLNDGVQFFMVILIIL